MHRENRATIKEKLAVLPMWVIDRIKEEMLLGHGTWEAITKAVEAAEVPEKTACAVRLPPATTFAAGVSVASVLMAIKQRAGFKPEFLEFTQPASQQHAEPIAWMVGTAFWWTKEEAERDAAATGLPTVGVGPMTGIAPAEQRQDEPVALPARLPQRLPRGRNLPKGYAEAWNACLTEVEKLGPLYTHADPNVRWESVAGEQMRVIEQLKAELGEAKGEYDRSANKVAAMVAQLAERDTLLREVLEAFKLEADGSCINPGRDFIRPWAAKLAALSSSAEPSAPADRAEVNEALLWLDDFAARCNGDDRGSCSAVETLRAALGSKS